MSLLREFLEAAPPGTEKALAALACAESLTDTVALAIYERVSISGLSAEEFVSAFKYSGLTEPRNSEWNLAPALRQELLTSGALGADSTRGVHQFLFSLAQDDENRRKAGTEVPSYLFTEAGLPYHLAASGNLEAALEHYSEASRGRLTGAQWLGAKLAEEQERAGVIPKDRVETTFLRALVLWREGHRRDALPLFRRVAATDLVKREVAISLHIVGNEHNRGQRRQAERELRRSIEIGRKLGDEFHVAQTLHSLANLLARQNRPEEAEKDYRESIAIDGKLGNEFGVAQTLHSLANLLARQNRPEEAEEAYRQSIEIGRKLGNDFHVAQTLHSLANLLARQNRPEEAEKAYRESIEIDGKLGNEFGVAQTLHSLANLLARQNRPEEAEKDYRKSIAILRKLGNEFGVAQTLHSLANLLAGQNRPEEAEEAYRQSIEIGENLRNENHLAQVLRSYALAIQSEEPDRAVSLLERSREINLRRGNTNFVRLVEGDIRRLQERAKGPRPRP